ncbi:MAG: alcohol dehydrogenase catalytic domain-containing protein [Candidatus Bathyarchaeia archaeon]
MKAIVRVGKGPREVELRDVDYPKPKPGWVTVAVKACGICGSDLHMYLGEWIGPESPILGHEFSGEVVEVGKGVENFVKGDRVACMPKMSCGKCYYCKSGKPFLCENEPLLNGAMAEYVAAPEYTLFNLPKEVTYEEGALLEPLAVAVSAVYETSHVRPGQTIVIIGPGPIGLLTLVSAKLSNPEISIVSGTSEDKFRLQMAEKLGANVVINVNEEDPVRKVKELTEGLGADIVYECAGAGLLDQTVEMLRSEGELVAVGHPAAKAQIKFSPTGFLNAQFKRLKIFGHIIYSWEAYRLGLQLVKHKIINLKPFITHMVPLSDAAKGFELALKKETIKVLIIP